MTWLNNIRAISFDLDDTLWPTAPAIHRAEQAAIEWMRRHTPKAVEHATNTPFRLAKQRLAQEYPELAHNISAIRLKAYEENMYVSGENPAHAKTAFMEYYNARQNVSLFSDVMPGIRHLSKCYVLVAVTNGNADPERTPLKGLFRYCMNPERAGVKKPDPALYEYLLGQMGWSGEHVLHLGDDPVNDVEAAANAGFRTALIDREQRYEALTNHADIVVRNMMEFYNLLNLKY